MKRLEIQLSATIEISEDSASERVRGITKITRALEPTNATCIRVLRTIVKNGGLR